MEETGGYLDGAAALGGSLDVVPWGGRADRKLADASVDNLGLGVALGRE